MLGTKKSAYFHNDVAKWLAVVMKREGFNFSQAVNWILRKAMENDRKN